MNNLLNEFTKSDKIDIEEILSLMLTDDDIELKTEIHSPLNLARLRTIAIYFELEDCPESAKVILEFINSYLKYMVSYNRQSRKEIIEAIANKFKKDLSFSDKMLGKNESD